MRVKHAAKVSVLALALAGPALAESQSDEAPATIWTQDRLLGENGGMPKALSDLGLSYGLQDINEAWSNASGGRRQIQTYNGLTMFSVGLDTKAAFGWEGGTFNVSAFQIRGRSLATDATSALQTNTGINALGTTRFWEIWFQQLFAGGAADIKLGQVSLDTEFMTSQGSSLFLNTMMGWSMYPSANLYAGGPAYPLSSLGVRLRYRANDNVTILGGVFADNPPGGPFNADGQLLGSSRWGGNFNLRTGALAIGEIQYAFNQPTVGEDGKPKPAEGLPGTYKLGFWYDSGTFFSQRTDSAGIPLASPYSNGDPRRQGGNWSLYGVADQAIWRPAQDGAQMLSLFVRAMGGPGDRNLISFSLNGGITLKDPLAMPERENDTLGVGLGIARLSGGAIGYDQDVNHFGGNIPVRSTETFVELTYQFAIAPWWQIQPDFQYVFSPGGGIVNPNNPPRRIGNEAIFGIRSTITF